RNRSGAAHNWNQAILVPQRAAVGFPPSPTPRSPSPAAALAALGRHTFFISGILEPLADILHRQGRARCAFKGGSHDILRNALAPPIVEKRFELEVESV